MANFDLSNLALQAVCPNNEILYDDKNIPSVMVKIPKMTMADLGIGDSTYVHPAFIVNGSEVDAIYISKYPNIVYNNRAYSLPAKDPANTLTTDTAKTYCSNKGAGWHLMTRAEWALLALWCKANDTQPKGNNDHGKDVSETTYKAIPANYSDTGQTNRTLTGTGPLSWSHDGTPAGIMDLNGNVSEWVGGIRTVYGELQVLADNNAADASKSQAANSSLWKAIDATTGEYITPNGSGTTSNSIKLDFVSNKWRYKTSISSKSASSRNCLFGDVTCDSTISDAAKNVLYVLALLPCDSTVANYNGDVLYINNGIAEGIFVCGGGYGTAISGAPGVFFCHGFNTRTYAGATVGFRAAFVKLPTD